MDQDLADRSRLALQQRDWADALALLARAAVDAGLCSRAGVAEVVDKGTFRSIGSTDPMVDEVIELQCESGQGPCLDATTGCGVVHSIDASADERWPVWGPEAGRRGIGGVVSVHLSAADRSLGTLVLYHRCARTYSADDLTAARLIGAHASIALAHFHDTEHLWRAIDARHRIGQAQGILMERFNITTEAAFVLLRRLSQDGQVKLHLIADQVVRTRTLPTTFDPANPGRPTVKARRWPDLSLPRAR